MVAEGAGGGGAGVRGLRAELAELWPLRRPPWRQLEQQKVLNCNRQRPLEGKGRDRGRMTHHRRGLMCHLGHQLAVLQNLQWILHGGDPSQHSTHRRGQGPGTHNGQAPATPP